MNKVTFNLSEKDTIKAKFNANVSGGVTDYPLLTNLPSINEITLIGNKTSEDLGLLESKDLQPLNNKYETLNSAVLTISGDIEIIDQKVNATNSRVDGVVDAFNHDIETISNEIEDLITDKADKSETYTKSEVDTKISTIKVDAYTKSETNNLLSQKANQSDLNITNNNLDALTGDVENLSGEIENKQDKINDLDTIRAGASKGATALQTIPIASANVVGGVAGGNWLTVNQTTGKMECGELTKAQYDSALGYTFISKTTLENVLDGDGYVKNTDYASSVAGVIKTSGSYAVTASSNGYIQTTIKTATQYEDLNNNAFIGKGTLENIKESLVTSVGDSKYQPIGDYATNTRVDEVENNKTQVIIRSW